MSLECNNTDVVAFTTTLLTAYLQVCIECKDLRVCAILYLHIYTQGMLKGQPMLITIIDLIVHVYMCLEQPFPSLWWGGDQSFSLAFHLEWQPPLRPPGACTDVHAKSGHDIIGASYDDVLMMSGFWMMTFTSCLHQDWGYKRKNSWGGRAYRAELIPSSVLWCVPISGQPGIL